MDLEKQQLWSGDQTRGWWSMAGVLFPLLWHLHLATLFSAPRTSSPSSIPFAPMPGASGLSSPPTSLAKTPDQTGLKEDLRVDRSGQDHIHFSTRWDSRSLTAAYTMQIIKFLLCEEGHTYIHPDTALGEQ